MSRRGFSMKTINRSNIDEVSLADKASIKKLKKKSKYLRKMKQKNGNLNLFQQSGEVKETLFHKQSLDLYPYPDNYCYEEDCV